MANSPGSRPFAIYPGYCKSLHSASKHRFIESSLCTLHYTRFWLFSGDQRNVVSTLMGFNYLLSELSLTLSQRALSERQLCPYPILAQKLPLIPFFQNLPLPDPQDQGLIWATSDHPSQHLYSSQTFHSQNNPCLFLFSCSRSLSPSYITRSISRSEPIF